MKCTPTATAAAALVIVGDDRPFRRRGDHAAALA